MWAAVYFNPASGLSLIGKCGEAKGRGRSVFQHDVRIGVSRYIVITARHFTSSARRRAWYTYVRASANGGCVRARVIWESGGRRIWRLGRFGPLGFSGAGSGMLFRLSRTFRAAPHLRGCRLGFTWLVGLYAVNGCSRCLARRVGLVDFANCTCKGRQTCVNFFFVYISGDEVSLLVCGELAGS